MEADLFNKIWTLSIKKKSASTRVQLISLTEQLLKLYDSQGRLDENPLNPSRKRRLSLPTNHLKSLLSGKVCLVTGGLGCVGSKFTK